MNWYNIIFFHIFTFYYEEGKYKKDIPWLTASCLVATSTSLYVLSFYVIIEFFLNSSFEKIDNHRFLIFGIIMNVSSFIWFAKNKKYSEIYNKYRLSKFDTKKFKFVAWLFVVLGFLTLPLAALYIHSR